MGLFVKVEDKGKYFQVTTRKFAKIFSYSAIIAYFIIVPIIYAIFRNNFTVIAVVSFFAIVWILGMWLAIEGIYLGNYFPKKYEKKGKKVVRDSKGIKIYK